MLAVDVVWDKDYPLLITTYSSHYMRSIAVVKYA
nr:MAG TPA: hypothetical protein [Caudoviricetes sp.]DAW69397.1 MAG TPA: hypothetical protein [Caudoviricetes sp.]